jgi:hypothetical protein
MATKEELSEELTRALRQYGVDYGFVITDKSLSKMMKTKVFETVGCGGVDGKRLCEALMKSGKILEQSDDGKRYIAVVGAGVANRNVAFVVLALNKESLSAAAVAREGIIKQGTARKAIDRVWQAL